MKWKQSLTLMIAMKIVTTDFTSAFFHQERMCVRIGLKDIWCLKEAYYAEILQNWDLLETLTEED